MLTVIIFILFIFAFYTGYRQGLALQVVRLLGYLITFVIAIQFYQPLSEFVEMLIPFPSIQPDTQLALYNEATSFILDRAFYQVITFMIIGFIGWLLTNFLSLFFIRVKYFNFLSPINAIGGGIISLLFMYVVVFLGLFILSLIPIEFIQQLFVDNPMAFWIVANTPILANFAADTWLQVNPF